MSPDGRKARGDERRRQLVDAAQAVLARDGLAGLTHRAVADEAGVALSSVSYHYAGIDDLARSALVGATEAMLLALEERDDDGSRAALAAYLVEDLDTHRPLYIAYYELYLLAMRTPDLRADATAWLPALTDRYAPSLEGDALAGLQATIEGLCLHAMLSETPPSVAKVEAALAAAWPASS